MFTMHLFVMFVVRSPRNVPDVVYNNAVNDLERSDDKPGEILERGSTLCNRGIRT